MTDHVGLSIVATECSSACANEPDFEQRVRKAMAVVAKGHWMLYRDDQEQDRFKGALAAVLLAPETTQAEKDRIGSTVRQMGAMSAMITGVPVDLEAVTNDIEANPPYPLRKWWVEAKEAVKP